MTPEPEVYIHVYLRKQVTFYETSDSQHMPINTSDTEEGKAEHKVFPDLSGHQQAYSRFPLQQPISSTMYTTTESSLNLDIIYLQR